ISEHGCPVPPNGAGRPWPALARSCLLSRSSPARARWAISSSRGLALARRIEAARLSSLGLGAVMTPAPRRSSWYCGAPARPGRRAPLFRLGQAQLFQGRLLVGGQLRHERLVVCGTHVAAHEVELVEQVDHLFVLVGLLEGIVQLLDHGRV